jgi:hypothetical protein
MALPGEYRNNKVTSVEDAVRNLSAQQLAALPPLDDHDFHLFDVIIQHFGFIDLNLRRAVEIFYLAKRLPDSAHKAFPNQQDGMLTDVLIEVIQAMDQGEEPVATIDLPSGRRSAREATAKSYNRICDLALSGCEAVLSAMFLR